MAAMSKRHERIGGLPVELVTDILEYVEIPYRLEQEMNKKMERPDWNIEPDDPWLLSRRTLCNACLVTRTFHGVAWKLLYRNIKLLHGTEIVLLFRTLFEEGDYTASPRTEVKFRPSIENLACLVTLIDEAVMKETAEIWSVLILPKVIGALEQALLDSICFRPGEILVKGSNPWYTAPQCILGGLLGFTYRLKSLTLQWPVNTINVDEYKFLDDVLGFLPRNSLAVLPCLHTLAVQAEPGHAIPRRELRAGKSLFRGLLKLPALATFLDFVGVGPPRAEDFPAAGIGLDRLVLYDNWFLRQEVEAYARVCPGLRHLEIFGRNPDIAPVDNGTLQPAAARLRSLVLRTVPSGLPPEIEDEDRAAAIAAAAGDAERRLTLLRARFGELRDLTVEDHFLFRDAAELSEAGLHHRLPASLENLVLIERWGPAAAAAAAVADASREDASDDPLLDTLASALVRSAVNCPEHLPRLRRFVFDRRRNGRWRGTRADAAFRERCPDLVTKFASVGVEFVVLHPPPLGRLEEVTRMLSWVTTT